MDLRLIAVVFAKEVIDNLRDRRSVLLALFYPFFGPVLVGTMIVLVGQAITNLPTTVFTLPVVGAARAPELIAFLKDNEARVIAAPDDPETAVRSGARDVVLVIPDGYAQKLDSEASATVRVIVDGSRLSATLAMSRTLTLLREYAHVVATRRLEAYGVDPRAAEPLSIRSVNVSVGKNLVGFFLNMMPPFIIFTIFVGGVYLAIDATTGERERGSMEPLLTAPISRGGLMLGKVGAALVFTATALAVHLAAFLAMFQIVSAGDLGLVNPPGVATFSVIFLISTPLMLLAVALQTVIAAVSRSLKETQTYLGLLPLVPSLPGLVLVFVAVEAQGWMMVVPGFGQTVLIGLLVRGEPIALGDALIASAVVLALAAALLTVAAWLYGRERMVLGNT